MSVYDFESQEVRFQRSLPTNISMINNQERKWKDKGHKEEVFKTTSI